MHQRHLIVVLLGAPRLWAPARLVWAGGQNHKLENPNDIPDGPLSIQLMGLRRSGGDFELNGSRMASWPTEWIVAFGRRNWPKRCQPIRNEIAPDLVAPKSVSMAIG